MLNHYLKSAELPLSCFFALCLLWAAGAVLLGALRASKDFTRGFSALVKNYVKFVRKLSRKCMASRKENAASNV